MVIVGFVIAFIVVALGFMMSDYFIVDKNYGPVEALKKSFRLMWGFNLWLGFVLWLLVICFALAGCLALCVGWLFAYPLALVLVATAYVQVTNTFPKKIPTIPDDHEHLSNEITTTCSRCGEFICQTCGTTLQGKPTWWKCYQLLMDPPSPA